MSARCGEQGAQSTDRRADLIFDAFRKHAIARVMIFDDCISKVVTITWCNF